MNGFCSSLSPLSYAVGIWFVRARFGYIKWPFEKQFTREHPTNEHSNQLNLTKPKKIRTTHLPS